jgi:hypothetical protein
MIKEITTKILRVTGYALRAIAVFFCMFIMIATFMPFVLIFFFKGWWYLSISFIEWCSVSETKKMFAEGKYVFKSAQCQKSFYSITNQSSITSEFSNDLLYNPSHASFSYNIYHIRNKD